MYATPTRAVGSTRPGERSVAGGTVQGSCTAHWDVRRPTEPRVVPARAEPARPAQSTSEPSGTATRLRAERRCRRPDALPPGTPWRTARFGLGEHRSTRATKQRRRRIPVSRVVRRDATSTDALESVSRVRQGTALRTGSEWTRSSSPPPLAERTALVRPVNLKPQPQHDSFTPSELSAGARAYSGWSAVMTQPAGARGSRLARLPTGPQRAESQATFSPRTRCPLG